MATEIKVPTLGESVTSATVARWMKKPGEPVAADEPLVELETDKVTVEVNAPAAGVLADIAAPEGAEVEVGALLGMVEADGAGAGARPQVRPETPAAAATQAEAPAAEPPPQLAASQLSAANPPAGVNPPPLARGPVSRPATPPADQEAHRRFGPMPAAAKLMTEHGIEPAQIGEGTGKEGRVTKGDVIAFINRPVPAAQSAAPKSSPAPAAKAPPEPEKREPDVREERVRMTRLRRTIAARLKEAQNTAAMLTTFNEVDMTAAMALRSEYREAFEKKNNGTRLGFMSFFVRACVAALQEFPAVNAEIDGE